MNREISFSGALAAKVQKAPKAPLTWRVRNTLRPSFILGWLANLLARSFTLLTGIPTLTATLSARLIKASGEVVDYGVVCHRVVTTAFAIDLVDELQASQATFSTYRYHGSGTDNTAEDASDTELGVEVESRASGTQTEASTTVYRSVGTVAYTATRTIVEHGLFDSSSSGTLMDRSVFTGIGVNSGDSIQFTYDLTVNAGG